MQILIGVLVFVVLSWLIFGLLFAMIWYFSTGLQPKIIGWPLTILAFAYLTKLALDQGVFAIIVLIHFALTVGVIFIFDRGNDENWREDTLKVRFSIETENVSGIRKRLVNFVMDSFLVYPAATGVFWVFLLLDREFLPFALAGSMMTFSVILLTVQIHGGKKEKSWAKLKEFLTSGLKRVPSRA